LKVAIAGASGFIGQKLIEQILEKTDWDVVALSRQQNTADHSRVEWRQVDMFSALQAEEGLLGVQKAFYLVHSMMPSARLDQGNFEDYDLLLADNFARSAEKNNLEHIVFLGGILPEGQKLSSHLKSRFEVESVFQNRSFSVTTARAGLIVGEGGSSFQIMSKLIDHLPVLICPSWAQNPMTPVDRDDAVESILEMAMSDEHKNKIYEIGGPKTYSYFELLQICAKKMNRKRLFLKIPIPIMAFSRLWVRLFSGASKELVYPLLDSLKMPMALNEERRFKKAQWVSYEESVEKALHHTETETYHPKRYKRTYVRSVQRLKIPAGKSARWAAEEYMRWLLKFLRPLIVVDIFENNVSFCLMRKSWVALRLRFSADRSLGERQLFYIKGGFLAKKEERGRLEFRRVLNSDYLIVAIHDYYPALPWYIYIYTQAIAHLWVMRGFESHLKQMA
jgi:uncharacterized protein YbjT (DUF2867 family)